MRAEVISLDEYRVGKVYQEMKTIDFSLDNMHNVEIHIPKFSFNNPEEFVKEYQLAYMRLHTSNLYKIN